MIAAVAYTLVLVWVAGWVVGFAALAILYGLCLMEQRALRNGWQSGRCA